MPRRGVVLAMGLDFLRLMASAVWANDRVQCTTRWDAGLQRYLTECKDGSRVISK